MAKKKSKSKKSGDSKKSKASTAGKKKKSTKAGKKKKPAKGKPVVVTHDQIAKRAFELWMDRGQPSGQDEIIWHDAEAELLGR